MTGQSEQAARPPAQGWLPALGLVALFVLVTFVNFQFWQLEAVKFVENDISYYGYHLNDMLENGNDVMPEYPLPALWILQAIYTVGGGWQTWAPWFSGVMLALTGIVAITLFRRDNARGALFWILFMGACGPIVWFRFDLIPAALVAWACLWITARPRLAGALVAMGASVKLWPALLAFPMAAPDPLRRTKGRQRVLSFLVVGFALGMSSLVLVGWERSVSPVTWQSERGLQQESVPATPLMFLRTFTDSPDWNLFLSEYNAIELDGPGVEFLLTVSSVLTAGSFVLTGLLTWRLVRRFREDSRHLHEAMLLVILAIVLATIVVNKTLSPQYVTWLGGPVAALLLARRSHWLRRPVVVLSVAMVVVAGLTQYTYPWGTHGIMALPNGSGLETSMLILRNLLLVGLLGYATRLAWRATSSTSEASSPLEQVESELDREEPVKAGAA
ncbi:glycosyltransferase family 87 protein [Tessaracoccus terricola]